MAILGFTGCGAEPTVSAAQDPADTTAAKPGKGRFGILTDASGSPLAGATVWAVPENAIPLPKLAAAAALDSAHTDDPAFGKVDFTDARAEAYTNL